MDNQAFCSASTFVSADRYEARNRPLTIYEHLGDIVNNPFLLKMKFRRKFVLKKIISIIFISVNLIACNSPGTISGKLEGTAIKDLKIYLIEPKNLMDIAASYFGKIIDSAIVNSDGNFEFRNLPAINEPVLFELAVQQSGTIPGYLQTNNLTKSNYMPIVWQSGEHIQISAQWDEFQKSFSVQHPSEINKALLELKDIAQNAYQKYIEGNGGQSEDDSQLLEKEIAVVQYQTELINFADSTQYLIPALVAIRLASPEKNYERIPEFLVSQCYKWAKIQPDNPWVKQLCNESNPANLPVLIGDKFPDFNFPMITKDTLSLNDLLGSKLTIIDLWASWCPPCRKENREVLLPIWNEYHKLGLQIIAYALESDESVWIEAARSDGADRWYQASDLQGDFASFLKEIRIQTIPANFILDEKGIVIAKNVHGKALNELVKSLINQDN